MVSISKTNKRTSLHQKYKVAKKVRQHKRDVKKSLKNKRPKKELPIELQIPMDHPCKDKIFQELKISKMMDQEAAKRNLTLKNKLKKKSVKSTENKKEVVEDFGKLIEESDVMLMVLDARDPVGTRSKEAEALIKAANKNLIFVLNKIDLVPLDNLKAWLAILGKEATTFPIKSSVQQEANILGRSKVSCNPLIKSNAASASFGVEKLVSHFQSMTNNTSTKLVIGVCGVANTGKSSIINSIKHKQVCQVANSAGSTRKMQRIDLDNKIVLVDSLPITLAETDGSVTERALRNLIRVENIEDPVSVAETIFKRCEGNQLKLVYNLPAFDGVTDFMVKFATVACPLKKKGVPNLNSATKKLINDWTGGKIKHCCIPPACDDETTAMSVEEEASLRKVTFELVDEIPSICLLRDSYQTDDDVDMDGEDDDTEEDNEEDE